MSTVTVELPGATLDAKLRSQLESADIIIGVDLTTDREYTVFGTPPLESTCSLKKPTAMRIVRVALDGKSWGLERLVELIRAVKGHDELDEMVR